MKSLRQVVFCTVMCLAACNTSAPSLPTNTAVPQPMPSPTLLAAPSLTPTVSETPTSIITATLPPTATQVIAQNLGVTVSRIKEVFVQEGFVFLSPRTVRGMEVTRGSSQHGNRVEIYVKAGNLIYVEASVPNRGPQTNPSSLFLLLQTVMKYEDELEQMEYWLDNVAPGAADASPKMEATYIDKKNRFITYAHDKGYSRRYLKIYVSAWLAEAPGND